MAGFIKQHQSNRVISSVPIFRFRFWFNLLIVFSISSELIEEFYFPCTDCICRAKNGCRGLDQRCDCFFFFKLHCLLSLVPIFRFWFNLLIIHYPLIFHLNKLRGSFSHTRIVIAGRKEWSKIDWIR